ncbi:COMM domain-containing protein 10-like [Schistocerca cancellata]|uniref:COMM domain-containing protein 10-like n=1 Tax=Schistocerca cancellata TaxID=274614 RepID=UPI002117DDDA|nr:COMM domain-containing protein 10-like [Schistocerca cancellata]
MASSITANDSLYKAANIINGLDESKFPLLLSRIAQVMQQCPDDKKPFTEEEQEKLEVSLALDKDDLKLLIESSTLILQQAAYHMMKPTVLQQQLHDVLGLKEEKAKTFAQVWVNSAKGIVEQRRKKSVFPVQLEDVRWKLGLQMASDVQLKQKIPKATFQFGLLSDCEGEKIKENITLEFTHDELFEFHKKLEAIQSQLDALR